MAEIYPFRAHRYNTARVDPVNVLTQPYDKISAEMAKRYAAASPYNLIPVEKGETLPSDTPENNVYTRAARALQEWIALGVVVQDSSPSLYAYFQEYTVPGTGERQVRKGFIGLGRIEDYSAGVVFRHEQTLSGPKADRMELLRHTRTHTGQLFMLYNDPARRADAVLERASGGKPETEIRDEYGVAHRLWRIVDTAAIETIVTALAGKKLVIADGHHRYETAMAYRDQRRASGGRPDPQASHEKTMMTLFNTASEGLTILPTHRVVSNVPAFSFAKFREALEGIFDLHSYSFTDESSRRQAQGAFLQERSAQAKGPHAIGVYAGAGAYHLLVLNPRVDLGALLPDVSASQRQLDVVLLHRLVLERGLKITAEAVKTEKNLTYEREIEAAIAAVDQGRAQISFLLNAASVDTVVNMAIAGEVMPQKSTDFFPKLMSGIAMYRLE